MSFWVNLICGSGYLCVFLQGFNLKAVVSWIVFPTHKNHKYRDSVVGNQVGQNI